MQYQNKKVTVIGLGARGGVVGDLTPANSRQVPIN